MKGIGGRRGSREVEVHKSKDDNSVGGIPEPNGGGGRQ